MTFELIYEQDYKRLIPAIINDSRSVIPSLIGRDGNDVYAYSQSQINLVTSGVLFYRISIETGNLAGYIGINVVNGSASVLIMQLRPAFVPFSNEISKVISTFIINNTFLQDVLF